jgi:hypothetical protein
MDTINFHLVHGGVNRPSPEQEATRFPLQLFLAIYKTFPLEAKALLEAGVANGTVLFTLGTDDRDLDGCFRTSMLYMADPQCMNQCLGPDLELCQGTFGEGPTDELWQGLDRFPYSFTLKLLDRLGQGVPPLYRIWAESILMDLYSPYCVETGDNHLVEYPV